MLSDPTVLILMYFVLPLWLVTGFADWLCHRASHIETTTGAKEPLIHLLMFTEVDIPLLAATFLDIKRFDYRRHARCVCPPRGHRHVGRKLRDDGADRDAVRTACSQLPGIPLMGIIIVVSLHWGQFLALFGFGSEPARFNLVWKSEPLPVFYIVTMLVVVLLFEALPISKNSSVTSVPMLGS